MTFARADQVTRCFIAAALLPLCTVTPLRAQEPFSIVELQVNMAADISQVALHQSWRPGRGAALGVLMPFYAGDFEFGGAIHRYSARTGVPGFAALWLYAGWGVHGTWRERVSISGTARLGNYRMSFDDAESTFAGVSSESELVLGLGGGLALRLAGPVFLYGRLDRLYVQTLPSLAMWYVAAGMSIQIQAGEGWVNFFK